MSTPNATDANVIKIGMYMFVHLVPAYTLYLINEILTSALREIGLVRLP